MSAYYINKNIVRNLTGSHFKPENGDYDIQIGTTSDTRELESFFNIRHEVLVGENGIRIVSKNTELSILSFTLEACANGQIRMKSDLEVGTTKKDFCAANALHHKDIIIIFSNDDGSYTYEFYKK